MLLDIGFQWECESCSTYCNNLHLGIPLYILKILCIFNDNGGNLRWCRKILKTQETKHFIIWKERFEEFKANWDTLITMQEGNPWNTINIIQCMEYNQYNQLDIIHDIEQNAMSFLQGWQRELLANDTITDNFINNLSVTIQYSIILWNIFNLQFQHRYDTINACKCHALGRYKIWYFGICKCFCWS